MASTRATVQPRTAPYPAKDRQRKGKMTQSTSGRERSDTPLREEDVQDTPKASLHDDPRVRQEVHNTSGYDKHRLVLLVIRVTAPQCLSSATNAQDAKPDWDKVARETGKTPTQCKDTWRKTIQLALQANRPWSTTGSGWTSEMKIAAVDAVLAASTPDWTEIATTFNGKTPTQIKDVWRKVVLPRLKRGETIQ